MSFVNLHSLKKVEGSTHRRIRVGRGHGSGKGKTSGRGHKGQMARSGHKHKHAFEGGQMRLLRRVPKRGFNNSRNSVVFVPVSVAALMRFEDGSEVTPEILEKSGLARGGMVKILGGGELSRKLVVHAHAFSETAKSKITAAGGECKIVK